MEIQLWRICRWNEKKPLYAFSHKKHWISIREIFLVANFAYMNSLPMVPQLQTKKKKQQNIKRLVNLLAVFFLVELFVSQLYIDSESKKSFSETKLSAASPATPKIPWIVKYWFLLIFEISTATRTIFSQQPVLWYFAVRACGVDIPQLWNFAGPAKLGSPLISSNLICESVQWVDKVLRTVQKQTKMKKLVVTRWSLVPCIFFSHE